MNFDKLWIEECTAENDVLDIIKTFSYGTGHDILISEGAYKVYRAGEDDPYFCCSDEKLIDVINALKVLDKASTE